MDGDVGIAQGVPIETIVLVNKGCGVCDVVVAICEVYLPPVSDCGKWLNPERLNFFNYFRRDRRAV